MRIQDSLMCQPMDLTLEAWWNTLAPDIQALYERTRQISVMRKEYNRWVNTTVQRAQADMRTVSQDEIAKLRNAIVA